MTTAEKSTGFGGYLRNQRRAMGISIETVSQKTKIRVEILRHIENEDLGRLPSSAFVKGFVRAYADAIGTDAQEALRLFEASCTAHAECDMAAAPQKSRAPFWRGFLLACVALILLVYLTLSIARHMETKPVTTSPAEKESVKAPTAPPGTPSPTAAAAEPTPAQKADAAASPTPVVPEETPKPEAVLPKAEEPAPADADANATTETPATPQVQPAKLVLQIAAVELTWLRVTSDGKVIKEMTMKPDDKMTFEAEQRFDLVIGNAGGVQLTLNEQALGFPGKRGKVIFLKLP